MESINANTHSREIHHESSRKNGKDEGRERDTTLPSGCTQGSLGQAKIGNRKRPIANLICAVCGDKALGCNFRVITCESCKAFFRRNAFRRGELLCEYENNCVVNAQSRKYCQKCRLGKCFEVGMRVEHMMTKRRKYHHILPNTASEFDRSSESSTAGSAVTAKTEGDDMVIQITLAKNELLKNIFTSTHVMEDVLEAVSAAVDRESHSFFTSHN